MIEVVRIQGCNPVTMQVETLNFTSSADYFNNGQVFIPLISERLDYSESLYLPGNTGGEMSIGKGSITVSNPKGILDKYKDYGFDGRTIEVYLLESDKESLTSNNLYFTGIMAYPYFSWDSVTWNIRSKTETLNIPMQEKLFEGTNSGAGGDGGYEGSETLKGQVKPQLFGRCNSVEGAPINGFFLMYGFNFDRAGNRKAIHRVYTVHVKGAEYLYDTDYEDAESLRLATIDTGFYSTCLAEGIIRLGSVPSQNGKVVACVADAPEYECGAGAVIGRVLEQNAGLIPGVDYDPSGLSELLQYNSCPSGYYCSGSETIAAVVSDLLEAVNGWMAVDPLGYFYFGAMELPDALYARGKRPVAVLSSSVWGDDIERKDTGDESKNIPAFSVKLGHSRNWEVQAEGSFVEAISARDKEFLSTKYRYEEKSNEAVKELHPLAPSLTFDTLLNQPLDVVLYNKDFMMPVSDYDWKQLGSGSAVGAEEGWVTLSSGLASYAIYQELKLGYRIFRGQSELKVSVKGSSSPSSVAVSVYYGSTIVLQEEITIGLENAEYTFAVNIEENGTEDTYALWLSVNNATATVGNLSWKMTPIDCSIETECQKRLDKASTPVERYVLTIPQEVYKKSNVKLGQLVTLKDDRFGLSTGKNFTVTGIDQDGDAISTTLDVWG